jgi:hypothetical protein
MSKKCDSFFEDFENAEFSKTLMKLEVIEDQNKHNLENQRKL